MTPAVPLDRISRLAPNGLRALAVRSGTVLAITVGAAALSVVAQVVVSRALGVSGFGDYSYVLAWINVFSLVALLGTETAALRFVAGYAAQGAHQRLGGYVRWSLRLVGIAVLVLATLWLLGLLLFHARMRPSLVNAALAGGLLLPVAALLRVFGAYVQGLGHAAESQAIQGLLRGTIFVFLTVTLASLHVVTPAVAVLASTTAAFMAALFLVPRIRHLFSLGAEAEATELAQWRKTAWPLLLIGIAQLLLASTDTLVLGMLRGTRDSGLYVVGSQLASMIGLGIAALTSVIAPGIAERWAKGDMSGLRTLIERGRILSLGFALTASAGLMVLGPLLLRTYGPEFSAAYPVLLVLLLGQLLMSSQYAAGFLLTMTGREQQASRTIVSMCVLNLLLNFALIPHWGALGAASATAFAVASRAIVLSRYAQQVLASTPPVVAV